MKKLKKFLSHPYLLFLYLVLIIYFQSFFADFITWDDNFNITENPTLLSKDFLGPWKGPYYGYYMPITATIWILIYYLTQQLNPFYYHAINVLLHWINCLLCFEILKLILNKIFNYQTKIIPKFKNSHITMNLKEKNEVNIKYAAFFGALIFCVHPIQVEVVSWITCLRDLLSTMFSFICLVVFIKYLDYRKSKRLWWMSVIAFALGLLSKPAVVGVPFCILLIYIFLQRSSLIQYISKTAVFFVMSFVIVVITKFQAPDQIFTHWIAPLYLRPLIFIDSLGFYLIKLVFPLHFAANYTRTSELILNNHLYVLTTLCFVCVIGLCVFLYKKIGKWIWLGIGIWVVGLIPVSGFIPFSYQAISNVADRYMYLPLLGICLCVSLLFYKFKDIMWLKIIFFIFISLLVIRSYMRVNVWKNDFNFFTACIEDNPISDHGYIGLGVYYYKLNNFQKAEYYFKQAMSLDNKNPVSISNLLSTLLVQQKIMEAKKILDDRISDSVFLEKTKTRVLHISQFYTMAAIVEKTLNNFDKSYEYFCKAYQINKYNTTALNLAKENFYLLVSQGKNVSQCF